MLQYKRYPKNVFWNITCDGIFSEPRVCGRDKRYYRKKYLRQCKTVDMLMQKE